VGTTVARGVPAAEDWAVRALSQMRRNVITILVGVLFIGCAAHPSRPSPPISPGPELTFIVREAGRLPLRELSGVTVIMIGRSGERSTLGHTFGGRLRVPKERLRNASPQVVLFCLEGYQCGAVWLDAPEWRDTSIYSFNEYNVDLAPFVLYD
jgi:hypothetical protein